jgi:hypothetical protein
MKNAGIEEFTSARETFLRMLSLELLEETIR